MEHDSCEILKVPKIKGGKYFVPFNETCMLMPWVEKAKQNCIISYHCFDNATYPDPKNVKCVRGDWDYKGPGPECKGMIIYVINELNNI